jgi:hypothetical protein
MVPNTTSGCGCGGGWVAEHAPFTPKMADTHPFRAKKCTFPIKNTPISPEKCRKKTIRGRRKFTPRSEIRQVRFFFFFFLYKIVFFRFFFEILPMKNDVFANENGRFYEIF